MESIAELRQICQTTAKRDQSNVYMRYVCRFLSIYLTRFILPTSMTPNQVSFAMIVTGVTATLFFLSPVSGMFVIGAFLLQLWYLLDCMDGEVARYRHFKTTGSMIIRKEESGLSGMYYDIINHYIINLMVPATVGIGIFYPTGNPLFLFLGIAGAVGQELLLAMHDGKNRVLLAHLRKYQTVSMAQPAAPLPKKTRTLAHFLFMGLHYAMTYPTVMNLVGLTAILELTVPVFPWRAALLIGLTLGSLTVAAVTIARNISLRLIEKERSEGFILSEELQPIGSVSHEKN